MNTTTFFIFSHWEHPIQHGCKQTFSAYVCSFLKWYTRVCLQCLCFSKFGLCFRSCQQFEEYPDNVLVLSQNTGNKSWFSTHAASKAAISNLRTLKCEICLNPVSASHFSHVPHWNPCFQLLIPLLVNYTL